MPGRQGIPVYGDGSNVRDWLYVEDHCRGIDTVLRRGRIGETYNIGGQNEWSNLEIARLICRRMDERRPQNAPHERLITFVADRPGHDWRYAVDTTKIGCELEWQPRESFESGLAKTLDWYLGAFADESAPSTESGIRA
jgi:dTDP-glucose 4,6-dehydratase